jgi:acyl-CoA reductase-like NAD-dependent aldehyde dehydrogenase
MATGCTAVVVASHTRPLGAVTLCEVLATSDVPGGAVNVLTGRQGELAPVLAAHMDVNAIDLTGAEDAAAVADLQTAAADNVKRVFWPSTADWAADPGLDRIRAWVEIKTVWHPIGM